MSDDRDTKPANVPWDPSGGAWVKGLIPDILAAQADAEAHASTCTDRPCERCDRFVCRCGADVDGGKQCATCADATALTHALGLTRASIPPRFRWTIDVAPDLLASRVKAPRALVDRGLDAPPSQSLLFTGQTGAGKTSLAVAMLDAWVRVDPYRRRGSLFVEASWLSRARARHRLGQGEAQLVADAIEAPLLLLDDLGQEREDRDGCITDVVYGRSNLDLPTWVTCGLANGDLSAFADHLSRRYDGGFVRRILETGKRVELGR